MSFDRADVLRRAVEALRSGRPADALTQARTILVADSADPAALHLAGVALLRSGQAAEAVEHLRRAVMVAPAAHESRAALAMSLREQGNPRAAVSILLAAPETLALAPALARELGLAMGAVGDDGAAVCWLRHAARLDPLDFDATQRLVDTVANGVRGEGVTAQVLASGAGAWDRGLIDVGMCSIDPTREAAARKSLQQALGGEHCRFHVIHDARSLAEGYNRLLERMTGDTVILCHDDIEVLGEGFAKALARALERADLVGVAGARRVCGPAVLWAGHPHIHGWVSYPREGGCEVAPLSLESGLLEGMQALDGVFLAMRGEVARAMRFDAQVFDGFHFYDLDFTYRAAVAGYRLAVSTDLQLLHASAGQFGDDWKRYAARFTAKYPALAAPQGSPHWYGARLATRDQAREFYRKLREVDGAVASLPAMPETTP